MTDVVVVNPVPGNTVVVSPPIGSTSSSTVVEINAATTGPQGPQGIQGLSGGNYIHTQNSAASVWTINHNLAYKPNVVVVDSGGSVVEGTPAWISDNQITITFSAAFAGVAYLS
jgi:hypothetical protein